MPESESSVGVPRVSVVMPVYNGARYLREAMASILDQTYGDLELIVVDDGSEDRSATIARGFAGRDPRVRVLSRPNTGIVGALNDGLAAARGPLIARMDSDDVSLPGRLAAQVGFLDEHPECVAVGTGHYRIDVYGLVIGLPRTATGHAELDAAAIGSGVNPVLHPSAMMRSEAVGRVGGYRQEACWSEDLDLFLRLAEIGQIRNIPARYLLYRYHPYSICRTKCERQIDAAVWSLREGWSRRGIEPPLAGMEDFKQRYRDSTLRGAKVYEGLIVLALRSGSRGNALRHAASFIRSKPLSLRAWKALRWAVMDRTGV